MANDGIKQVILILPKFELSAEMKRYLTDVERFGFGLIELLSEAVKITYILLTDLRNSDDYEEFQKELADWAYTDAEQLLNVLEKGGDIAHLKGCNEKELEYIINTVSMSVSLIVQELGQRFVTDINIILSDMRIAKLEEKAKVTETDVEVFPTHYRVTITFLE